MIAEATHTSFRTPEFGFIVQAVIWPRSEGWKADTKAAAAAVTDWGRVWALVYRHRVAGLVASALAEAEISPAGEFRTALAAQAREDALNELRAAHETLRLVRLFEAAAVESLVLKGVSTAMRAFGRLGLRSSVDIDLLVRKSAVGQASDVLRLAGYHRTEPPEFANSKVMAARMARYKDFVFTHPGTGAIVELHWRLFQNPHLPQGSVSPAAELMLPSGRIPVLEDDFALLYLVLHGAEHAWARLKWLADLSAILSADPGRAERLYAQARATSMQRMVGPGLLLSNRLFGSELPAALVHDLSRDWRMRWLVTSHLSALVGGEDGRELEDVPSATTRKNLGHYLVTNDPRHWFRELLYDLQDDPGDPSGGSRFLRLVRRLLNLLFARKRVEPSTL